VRVSKTEKASEFRYRIVDNPRRFHGDDIVETQCGVVNDFRISCICTYVQSKVRILDEIISTSGIA
jgi:hypothetical protein